MNPQTGAAVETKLEAVALHVWFGERHALNGANLAVIAGRTVSLIGASGSGKTTLLAVVQPACTISIRERACRAASRSTARRFSDAGRRRCRAATPRRNDLLHTRPSSRRSIFDNVAFGLRAKGRARSHRCVDEKVERALRRVLLWDAVSPLLDRAPNASHHRAAPTALSCSRARARPRSAAVRRPDRRHSIPSPALAFEDVLVPLRRDHTVLIATNNLEQAARLSDTTCYLASGEVVESGETPLVFSRPTDTRTEDFLAGRSP